MLRHLFSFDPYKEFKINLLRHLSIARCAKIPQTHENLNFKQQIIYMVKQNIQYGTLQQPEGFSDEVSLNLK